MSELTNRLSGKVAVVTGASSGIGREVSRNLVAQGGQVVLIGRDQDRLRAVEQELGVAAFAMQTDVTDRAAITDTLRAVYALYGKIDILIANAGVFTNAPFVETTGDFLDLMLDVNLGGVFNSIQAVLPHMADDELSDIIIVSSIAGITDLPRAAAYSATKTGLQKFAHILRRELRGKGVRVGSICPGTVATEIWDDLITPEERAQRVQKNETIFPQDVARSIIYMLSQPAHVVIRDLTLLPQGQDV